MLPPRVSVPVTVNAFAPLASRNPSVFTAVPVRVKFAIVIAELLNVNVPEPVQTIDMPFQLTEAPPIVALAPVMVTIAVLAVIVMDEVPTHVLFTVPVTVMALAPIVSVRAFELFDENDPQVIV